MKKKLAIAFFFSGAAALMYQVLWARMLGLVFGNTTYAVSTVLAAFMGGMALGSWLIGRYADRPGFRPLRALALIEAGIGAAGAASPLLFAAAARAYVLAQQAELSLPAVTLLRLLLSAVILLVPTFLMGGTLPVMTRALKARLPEGELPGAIGLFYGVNTLGAVAGVLFTAFAALAYFGVAAALGLAVCLNLGIAALLYRLSAGEPAVTAAPAAAPAAAPDPAAARLALAAAAVSGFAAMVCEVAWTRSLAMIIGMSVYAFAVMLAAFLCGLAGGSFLYTRFIERRLGPGRDEGALAAGVLLGAAGILVLTTIPVFGHLPLLFLRLFALFGGVFSGLLAVQLLLAFLVMAAPALLFGVTFPALIKMHAAGGPGPAAVGRVYAFNTAGCIAGSLLAGFALLSLLGPEGSIRLAGFLCVGAALAALPLASGSRRYAYAVGGFLLLAAAPHLLAAGSWDRAVMNSGVYHYAPDMIASARAQGISLKEAFRQAIAGEELFYEHGSDFSVAVTRTPDGVLGLSIDGKVDASSDLAGDMRTQLLSGHLPMLLLPGAKKVLVIGLASGVTLGAVGAWPAEEIDCVELEPAMARASSYFAEWNRNILADRRVRLIYGDARNYLLSTTKKYDAIISVPSNVWVPGSSALFTREFAALAKSRLNEGGLFCQWVHLYELPLGDLKLAARALLGSFPEVSAWNPAAGDLLLVGAPGKFSIDAAAFEAGVKSAAGALAPGGFNAAADILSTFVMAGDDFRKFCGEGPANSDGRPAVEFSAPKYVYGAGLAEQNYKAVWAASSGVSRYAAGRLDRAAIAAGYAAKGALAAAEKEAGALLAEKPGAGEYLLYGRVLAAQGRPLAAGDAYRKALALEPRNPVALIDMCGAALERGDLDGALAYARKAIAAGGKARAQGYNFAGLAYLKKGGLNEAADSFAKAQQADPSYMEPYVNEARLYLDHWDVPPAALEILQRAAKRGAVSAAVYYDLGRAFQRSGLPEQAKRSFSAALAADASLAAKIKSELDRGRLQRQGA